MVKLAELYFYWNFYVFLCIKSAFQKNQIGKGLACFAIRVQVYFRTCRAQTGSFMATSNLYCSRLAKNLKKLQDI